MFLSRTVYIAMTVSLLALAIPALAWDETAPAPPAQKLVTPPTVPAPGTPPTVPAPKAMPPAPAPRIMPGPPPLVKLPAGVAARVNGKDITYADLTRKLQSWAGRPLVQQIVQTEVIEQEAKKYDVTIPPAELAAEVIKVKEDAIKRQAESGNGMVTWAVIARRDGISDAYVSDTVRLGLLARKTFQKRIEMTTPSLEGQIKIAHILIPTVNLDVKPDAAPDAPEVQAKRDSEAKAQAIQIIADINAKKITFEDAARKYSADKGPNGTGSAAGGGVLPYTGKQKWEPEFEIIVFGLKNPGDMVPTPVKSKFGYHIIRLIQKGSDAPAAEKTAYVKEWTDRQLQDPQGIGRWSQGVLASAKIVYDVLPAAPGNMAKSPSSPAPKPAPKKH